jgi:hypothetical protein
VPSARSRALKFCISDARRHRQIPSCCPTTGCLSLLPSDRTVKGEHFPMGYESGQGGVRFFLRAAEARAEGRSAALPRMGERQFAPAVDSVEGAELFAHRVGHLANFKVPREGRFVAEWTRPPPRFRNSSCARVHEQLVCCFSMPREIQSYFRRSHSCNNVSS